MSLTDIYRAILDAWSETPMIRQTESNLIKSLPLFKDVSDTHFEELVSSAFLQRFPQGIVLIQEGDLPDFLHIVVEGSVELFAQHNGHETALDIMQPVTTFILAAVIRDEVYLKSARTLTPTQILMIPAQAVRDVFDRDAAFARAIVNELAVRYRCVVRSLKNEKLRTSAERLANWILQEEAHQGNQAADRAQHRQADPRLTLGNDTGKFVAQSGAAPKTRRYQFGRKLHHQRYCCASTIRQAEHPD